VQQCVACIAARGCVLALMLVVKTLMGPMQGFIPCKTTHGGNMWHGTTLQHLLRHAQAPRTI